MSDGDPFRDGPAQPAALVALAGRAAAKRRELPRDAAALPSRSRRVDAALGVRPAIGLATIFAGMLGVIMIALAAINGAIVAGVLGGALIVGGVALDVALVRGARAEVARRLAAGVARPYPVTGYDVWLASERPLVDVHLRGAVAPRIVIDAAAALDPDIAIDWLDDRTFRVAIPAASIGLVDEPMHGGDERAWLRFADEILGPLHQDVGIERVEMGGSMRALPPAT